MRSSLLVAVAASALATCGHQPVPMVRIPAGAFTCGADLGERATLNWEKTAQPAHPVVLKEFLIDVHEVTNAEFERFDRTHVRNRHYSACDDCP